MATPASMVGSKMMGIDILRDALRNKGTAFTLEERERLGFGGMLPPRVATIEEQVACASP